MHEIIFSYFFNRFIIREISKISTVKPVFIGTYDECIDQLPKYLGGSNA